MKAYTNARFRLVSLMVAAPLVAVVMTYVALMLFPEWKAIIDLISSPLAVLLGVAAVGFFGPGAGD